MSEKINRIIFTGGGSGGHVVPAITLIEKLKKDNFEVHYFGSQTGIESKLTVGIVDKYHPIYTGKLRRYLSIENFLDLFKVFLGFLQSLILIFFIKKKNTVLFSMGGFVSVPVVLAAKIMGLKIYIHEQTTRVGLANKIASKFADKVFVSFEESLKFFPKEKTTLSGYPVRDVFYSNDLENKSFMEIDLVDSSLPILFVTGGGNGSFLLNEKIIENLKWLESRYIVIHQVGDQFISRYQHLKSSHYLPLAFVGKEMPDLMKAASVILSRSGAGTVAELISLRKKSIYVPLKIAQKNEQYHNAMAAKDELGSLVISEDDFKVKALSDIIKVFELSTQKEFALKEKSLGADFLRNQILVNYGISK